MAVHRWGVGAITLKSSKSYNDPVREFDVTEYSGTNPVYLFCYSKSWHS